MGGGVQVDTTLNGLMLHGIRTSDRVSGGHKMAGRGLIAGAEMALRAAGNQGREDSVPRCLTSSPLCRLQQQMFKMQEEMRKAADEQKRQQAVGSIIGRYNPESIAA